MTEEEAETLIAEYRPPQEVMDEDRITGPVIEGEEFIVGVGDKVYRAPLVLPWHQVWKIANARTNEEKIEVTELVFGLFKPEGIGMAFKHPANVHYVLGAWSNVSGKLFNERSTIVRVGQPVEPDPEPEVTPDDLGRAYYTKIRSQFGPIGRAMPEWDNLPAKTRASYTTVAVRRQEEGR